VKLKGEEREGKKKGRKGRVRSVGLPIRFAAITGRGQGNWPRKVGKSGPDRLRRSVNRGKEKWKKKKRKDPKPHLLRQSG